MRTTVIRMRKAWVQGCRFAILLGQQQDAVDCNDVFAVRKIAELTSITANSYISIKSNDSAEIGKDHKTQQYDKGANTMRILLIEDDALIGDGINVGLKKFGFTLDWFTDGQEGENALSLAPYDAVILDLTLPKRDGLAILKHWRQSGLTTPVLILTARDAIEQRVTGLQSGADDYVCKPFALSELAARLQALIRRNHQQMVAEIVVGDISYNPETQKVKKSGELVVLTSKETRLFALFLLNINKVLSRELIQEKLYSWSDDVVSNTVDVYIHNLRKKLGNHVIKTVYGTGYVLNQEQGE